MVLLDLLPSSNSDRAFRYRALRGDLRHRDEVLEFFGDFSPGIFLLFDNRVQASYIKDELPTFFPPGTPSAHTVGDVFEDLFFRSITFRARYVGWLDLHFSKVDHPTWNCLEDILPSLDSWR